MPYSSVSMGVGEQEKEEEEEQREEELEKEEKKMRTNSFSDFTKGKEVSLVCSLISSVLKSTLLDTEIISSFGQNSEIRTKYR